MADIPVVSWDETSPADSQNRSLGDNRITEIKTQIREILAVDHEFIYTGQGTYWGYHNKVTLATRTSNPVNIVDTIVLYAQDVSGKSELQVMDENFNIRQLTSAGDWVGGMAGEIRMWFGTLANIPNGWALCDGTLGRPNLIASFVYGIDLSTTTSGTAGGNDNVTMTTSLLPIHTHATTSTPYSHQHSYLYSYFTDNGNIAIGVEAHNLSSGTLLNDGTHSHSVSLQGNLSPTAWSNFPAYYELAFIAKTS